MDKEEQLRIAKDFIYNLFDEKGDHINIFCLNENVLKCQNAIIRDNYWEVLEQMESDGLLEVTMDRKYIKLTQQGHEDLVNYIGNQYSLNNEIQGENIMPNVINNNINVNPVMNQTQNVTNDITDILKKELPADLIKQIAEIVNSNESEEQKKNKLNTFLGQVDMFKLLPILAEIILKCFAV